MLRELKGERVHPVVLCGGEGRRLWPWSRNERPKPFLPLAGSESLLQQTLRRLGSALFAPPVIVAAEQHRFALTDQLAAAGITPDVLLLEPAARDTAAAVLAAAMHLHERDPQALLLITPADHLIDDETALHAAVQRALQTARAGMLVAFGVAPQRAETGYGYLLLQADAAAGVSEAAGSGFEDAAQPLPVHRFIEKPDAATARRLLASGRALWNAGIFLCSARAVLDAFGRHAADLVQPLQRALRRARREIDGTTGIDMLLLDADAHGAARRISFDHAVMEKAENVMAMPLATRWTDIGDWSAVWRMGAHDARGNVVRGDAVALDCRNSLLQAPGDGMQLLGIGLNDIIVAATADGVLVADKARAQEVRTALERLRRRQQALPPRGARVHRPWGWYECLARGPGFQVKRLLVRPGAALSLQSHRFRAEHWIVLSGRARACIGGKTAEVGVNESVFVPVGERHRLANPGTAPLVLIEVQTGSYLGEDDIIRHEDERMDGCMALDGE